MRKFYNKYNHKYLRRIARKVISGKSSESERRFLDQYYDFFENPKNDIGSLSEDEKQSLSREIREKLNISTSHTRSQLFRIYNPRKIAAAAAILLIFSIGSYLTFRGLKNTDVANKQLNGADKSITYGSNKAVLILSDGSRVFLDDKSGGTIAKQTGVEITKTDEGQIVYKSVSQNAEAAANSFNMMQTPKGGIYQIDLPDGTKVWLNSASTLRYPLAFSGGERKVQLEGEAYFEVMPDKLMPFKVVSKSQVVEVLGTHFNVNSYDDEIASKTTLLEGSIRVNSVNTGEGKIILPGQQVILHQFELKVKNVDPQNAIAWKNGLFQFDNEDIRTIMNKIARWYDVDVVYESGLKKMRFGGTVSRYTDLQDVLRKLELTNTIHFKVEGRRITVMK